MPITATTGISTEQICLNEARKIAVPGILTSGATYYPGQWVAYIVATQTWTLAINTTGAVKGMKLGIIDYVKQVNQTTGALELITTAIDETAAWHKPHPIITDGICVAYCVDNSAAMGTGTSIQASSTSGSSEIWDTTNHDQVEVGILAADQANGDTRQIVGIGRDAGARWGGLN